MISADALTLSEAAALVARATIVLSLTWLGARVAMRRSASTRHAVWAAGFIAALALPFAARAVPGWSLAVLPAAAVERTAPRADHLVGLPQPSPALPGINIRAPHIASRPSMPTIDSTGSIWLADLTTTGWVLLAWGVIGLALLLRYVVSLVAVFALTRRAEAVNDARWRDELDVTTAALGITHDPRLVMTDRVTVPFTCGFLRPTLVVPSSALAWTDDRIRVVLLHELAHVARRDCLVQAVVQAVCAVYWFHPLAWVGARHLRAERERACDDLVLAAGTRSAAYAEHLLDIARAATGTPRMAVAALAMARPSELEGRLLAILDRGRDRSRAERGLVLKVALLSAIVVLPLASVKLVARAVVPDQVVADRQGPSWHRRIRPGLRHPPRRRPAPTGASAAAWAAASLTALPKVSVEVSGFRCPVACAVVLRAPSLATVITTRTLRRLRARGTRKASLPIRFRRPCCRG
jgi:beta-lactamase regulating signal transducer with metallopeptidase domain